MSASTARARKHLERSMDFLAGRKLRKGSSESQSAVDSAKRTGVQ